MKNKIIISLFLIIMLVGFVNAESTATTDTICNGNICTKTLYSGVRNVYEDNQWKKIEDARSLLGSGIVPVTLENDKEFPVEIVDYNLTSITIKLNPKGVKIFGTDVPIRIWEQNQTKEENFKQDIIDGKEISVGLKDYKREMDNVINEDISFWLLNQEEEKTYVFGFGKILEFGYNSTTIILQNNVTENLEDTFIREGGGGDDNFGTYTDFQVLPYASDYRNMLFKFNASLPENMSIVSATLNLYLYDNRLDSGTEYFNISSNHLYNQSWIETYPTWDNFSGLGGYNTTISGDVLIIDSSLGWILWDITSALQNSYERNEDNFSLYLPIHDITDAGFGDDILFYSKEHTTPSERPYLNITYSPPPAFINITSPTNTTYTTLPTTLNWTIGGDFEDTCWYSIDLGITNTTVTCGDLNATVSWEQGSNQSFMWTNDSSNNVVSSNVTFYVDSIPPDINITYPTATTYSSIISTLNYTSDGSYCLYSTDNGVTNLSVQLCSVGGWTGLSSSEGINTWIVYSNDTFNNLNLSSVTFTYTLPPPPTAKENACASFGLGTDEFGSKIPIVFTILGVVILLVVLAGLVVVWQGGDMGGVEFDFKIVMFIIFGIVGLIVISIIALVIIGAVCSI